MTPEALMFCEEHAPPKQNWIRVFSLRLDEKDKEDPTAREVPLKCDTCGKQADWLVIVSPS
jgi:hypothetical protein